MNTKNKKAPLLFAVFALACAPAWSMISLSDDAMGEVSGQDGLTLQLTNPGAITVQQLDWQDNNAAGSTVASKQLQLRDISLAGLDATLNVDVGSSSGAPNIPALALNIVLKPFLFQAGSLCVANAGTTAACASSLGEIALRTTTDTTLDFYNTRGFFDGTTGASPGAGKLGIGLANAELYMAQNLNSQRDLILFRNLYLNGTLTGSFSIDAAMGLRMFGSLNLPRAGAISGFNLDVAVNPAIASGFTTAGASTLLHYGMSGTLENVDLRMLGGGSNDVITGATAADAGIRISLTTQLKNSDFEFEFGEGDASGHAIRFKNFVSFLDGNAVSPSVGAVSLGQLYLNALPAGTAMADFRTGFGSISQTVDSLAVGIRNLEMMAYPRNIYAYKYSDGTETLANPSGSMMLPLYDLDANLVLMPGGHPALTAAARRGIGFNLKAAFTGSNAGGVGAGFTGDKISGFLLADTAAGVGKYIGFRNVDGAIVWQQGQFFALDPATDGLTGLRISSASNAQINLSGQFALDDLPDGTAARKIKTTGHLFGLNVQLQSAGTIINIMPSPVGQSYIAITGSLNLQAGSNSGLAGGVGACAGSATGTGSCLAIIEPLDGSQIQLASISGKLNLTDTRIDIGKELTASSGLGSTGFGTSFARVYLRMENTIQFDPGTGAAEVFRIKDINFLGGGTAASPTPTTSYRFGEAVITGGELYSKIELRQR